MLRSRLPLAAVTIGLALAATAPAQAAPDVLRDTDRDGVFDGLEKRVRAAAPTKDLKVVVVLEADATSGRAAALEDRVASLDVTRRYDVVDAVAAEVDAGEVRRLAAAPGVRHVEPVRTVRAFNETAQKWFGVEKVQLDMAAANPAAPLDGNTDGLDTYSTNDMVAAVIDSGINETHPDLDNGKVLTFRDFTLDGVKNPPDSPGVDPNGHGTHVSGTVAGNDDEPLNDTDGDGVVPGAGLVGLRVLGADGRGSSLDVLDAINWVENNGAAYGIEAVNLSLGSEGCSDGLDAESQALNKLVALGYVVTVAAGNEGPGHCTIGIPAAAADVITVGAMADIDPLAQDPYPPPPEGFFLADFSSRGPTTNPDPVDRIKPDIVAPGVDVRSASTLHPGPADDYEILYGTSMAAPFVAGVALLMRDANATLTPPQVRQKISQTAIDFGRAGDDSDYGAGRLDAYAAVAASLPAGTLTTPPTYLPPFERFGSTLSAPAKIRSVEITGTSAAFPLAVGLTPDSNNANFTMFLRDADGGLLSSATASSRQKSLFISAGSNGPYTLDVQSNLGSGGFVLDVSGGNAAEGLERDAGGRPGDGGGGGGGVVAETPAPVNTSPPTVTGTAAVGQTLTGQPGTWTGATSFSYEWQRCSVQGTDCVGAGDTDTSYTVTESDAGRGLRLAETASNGRSTTAYSQVVTVPPANTALPTVQGDAREGSTLTVAPGSWTDAGTVTLGYTWERCDVALTACTAIASASGASYTPTAEDVASHLRVVETATGGGGSASVTSGVTAAVAAALRPPSNVSRPLLTGTARHGSILRLSNDSWAGVEPIAFGYQWLRCDEALAACEPVADATNRSYRLTGADVGQRVVGRVSGANSDGTGSADSEPSEVVEAVKPSARAKPSIGGKAGRGGALRARGGTWWGTGPLDFAVTWLRCSRTGKKCSPVGFKAAYVPGRADIGRRLRVRVVAENEVGRRRSTSAASAIVGALPSRRPTVDAPRRLSVRIASGPTSTPRKRVVRAL